MQAVAAEIAATPENSAAFWRGEFKLQNSGVRSCRSSGDEYLVESTASRVEIVIAWRLINHHPQTGKPPSHSATPELLQLLTSSFDRNIVILTLTWITNATARIIIDSKQDLPMKSIKKSTLFHLIIELTIYAVFVSVYLILVLHFLLDWLKELFTKQREVYAYVAILLMIGQAVGLERVTSSLVHLTRRRTE